MNDDLISELRAMYPEVGSDTEAAAADRTFTAVMERVSRRRRNRAMFAASIPLLVGVVLVLGVTMRPDSVPLVGSTTATSVAVPPTGTGQFSYSELSATSATSDLQKWAARENSRRNCRSTSEILDVLRNQFLRGNRTLWRLLDLTVSTTACAYVTVDGAARTITVTNRP